MEKYTSFQEIPQFPRSYYQIDVEWDHMDSQLGLLSGATDDLGLLDVNPPYQRGYVWTQVQKERYVEYMLRGGTSGRNIYFNMPNWSKQVGDTPWHDTLELVDGKQRLEAIRGFLNDEVLAFGSPRSAYSGYMRMTATNLKFHVGCLETPLAVVDWYLGMNNGGTVHTQKDIQVALDYRASLLVNL